jgi:hypothetical protein
VYTAVDSVLRSSTESNALAACSVHNGPPSPKFQILPSYCSSGRRRTGPPVYLERVRPEQKICSEARSLCTWLTCQSADVVGTRSEWIFSTLSDLKFTFFLRQLVVFTECHHFVQSLPFLSGRWEGEVD